MKKLLLLSCLLPAMAIAETLPRPGPEDPRIRSVAYDPGEVVEIRGAYGFQQMIEFGESEKVESISIGDSLGWQVAPNKAGNLLFLKPVEPKAITNLSVVSDRRSYVFRLVAGEPGSDPLDLTYVVRFRYPQDEEAKTQAALAAITHDKAQEVTPDHPVPPEAWNLDYRFTGKPELAPTHVFDDGTFTYFQFPDGHEIPAIFLVTGANAESLVNFHVSGRYVVVERTGRQFTLRSRDGVVCVFNEPAFRQPASTAVTAAPVNAATPAVAATPASPAAE
jgi:type IV secretion system protein VirB9